MPSHASTVSKQEPFFDRMLLGAGAFYLLVMPFTSSIALRNVALGLVLLAALALARLHWAALPRIPRGVLGALIAWLILAVSSLLWSIDPAYTLRELKHEALYPLIIFCVFFVGANARSVRCWSATLLAGVALLGLLAVGQRVFTGQWDAQRWHGGVGPYSTWLVMTFPLVLAVALPHPGFVPRIGRLRWPLLGRLRWPLFGLLVTLVMAGAYLTLNRMVWPSLAVSLAVFCALTLLRLRIAPGDRRRLLVTGGVMLGAFTVILALSAVNKAVQTYAGAATVQDSFEHDARIKVWRYTLERIAETPLAGHGFGRGIVRGQMQTALDDEVLWHGHNIALNALLQLGVAGLLLLALLLGALAMRYVAYLRAPAVQPRIAGVVGLALLAGFLSKNITDDFLIRHTGALFWALNGMLIGYAERFMQAREPGRESAL